jgi:hypothetical protein
VRKPQISSTVRFNLIFNRSTLYGGFTLRKYEHVELKWFKILSGNGLWRCWTIGCVPLHSPVGWRVQWARYRQKKVYFYIHTKPAVCVLVNLHTTQSLISVNTPTVTSFPALNPVEVCWPDHFAKLLFKCFSIRMCKDCWCLRSPCARKTIRHTTIWLLPFHRLHCTSDPVCNKTTSLWTCQCSDYATRRKTAGSISSWGRDSLQHPDRLREPSNLQAVKLMHAEIWNELRSTSLSGRLVIKYWTLYAYLTMLFQVVTLRGATVNTADDEVETT